MKLLILTQLYPTHCGISTLISSLSMITSMQQRFFWWSFSFSVCDATVEVGYVFVHEKAEQLTLRSKLSVFILLEHRIVTFWKKNFIWNAYWCTSEALKIILIAWARCWLGGLKQNQQTPSSRAQTPIFIRPSESPPRFLPPALVLLFIAQQLELQLTLTCSSKLVFKLLSLEEELLKNNKPKKPPNK